MGTQSDQLPPQADHPPTPELHEPAAAEDSLNRRSDLEIAVNSVASNIVQAKNEFETIAVGLANVKKRISLRDLNIFWRPTQHSALKAYQGRWAQSYKVFYISRLSI